jgi:hypothetical protein
MRGSKNKQMKRIPQLKTELRHLAEQNRNIKHPQQQVERKAGKKIRGNQMERLT